MLITTVGMVQLYDSMLSETNLELLYRTTVALGCFVQMIIIIVLRISHKGFKYTAAKNGRIMHALVRIVLACAHLCMCWYHGSAWTTIMYHSIISFGTNVLDIAVAVTVSRNYTHNEVVGMGIYAVDNQYSKHYLENNQNSIDESNLQPVNSNSTENKSDSSADLVELISVTAKNATLSRDDSYSVKDSVEGPEHCNPEQKCAVNQNNYDYNAEEENFSFKNPLLHKQNSNHELS